MIRRRERRSPLRERRRDQYENEYEDPRSGSGIKQLVILISVAFMVTVGVVIGTRLSSDAIAVLVGVIAGVAASIPCALLLMAVTRRQEERSAVLDDEYEPYPDRTRYDDRGRAVPPVIVVTPGQASQQQLPPWLSGQSQWNAWDDGASRPQRRFRVMGYDERDDD